MVVFLQLSMGNDLAQTKVVLLHSRCDTVSVGLFTTSSCSDSMVLIQLQQEVQDA